MKTGGCGFAWEGDMTETMTARLLVPGSSKTWRSSSIERYAAISEGDHENSRGAKVMLATRG